MVMDLWLALLLGVMAALTGYLIGIIVSGIRASAANMSAQKIIESAQREANVTRKDASVEAKNVLLNAREESEEQNNMRRKDILALEERIGQRETTLDRKLTMLDKKEEAITSRLSEIEQHKATLVAREKELQSIDEEKRLMLQQVASMTVDQARAKLMQDLEADLRNDAATLIRRIQEDAREQAEAEARHIISTAIERYAGDHVGSVTTSSVPLPNDEMKGRIIGKEGRNIRTLEHLTGCNILIDETPEVVVISGFDPLRREIARQALTGLIEDGRIHPGRIEEVVAKVQSEVEDAIRAAAEDAVYELKLHGLDPEVLRTVGRLKFRYSYGQNVLQHSVEVGHLMGMMASELSLDPALARRIGLLHDIGKAIDHSVEGGHALIGADLIRRYGELPVVVNAVAAHHNDVESESGYACLVKAADAITAARPGARSATTDMYLERLEKLEDTANSFQGVDKCFAMQAGREIRVLVRPEAIDDAETLQLARNISKRIEATLKYPGQIKVTVVRETRCVEYAK